MYLYLKWIHIVAVISWMAGILYLIRLFVYHAEYGPKSDDNHKLLSIMEKKLLYFITHPAMLITWITGLAILHHLPHFLKNGWFHAKFSLVILLSVFTIFSGRIRKKLANKEPSYSSKLLRYLNEVPTVLMIIIVWLVILKPF